MRANIEDRIIEEAHYIITNGATIRATAKALKVSKSCVQLDVHEKLKNINRALYTEVRRVVEKNKAERASRAGKATAESYKKRKEYKYEQHITDSRE